MSAVKRRVWCRAAISALLRTMAGRQRHCQGEGAAEGSRLPRRHHRQDDPVAVAGDVDGGSVFQAELKKAGINLDMQVVEHATYHQQIRQDLSPIVYYSAARFPIADVTLTQFFHSRSIVKTPTAVTNFSHCDVADKEIDCGARGDRSGETIGAMGGGAAEDYRTGLCRADVRDFAGFRASRRPRLRLRT